MGVALREPALHAGRPADALRALPGVPAAKALPVRAEGGSGVGEARDLRVRDAHGPGIRQAGRARARRPQGRRGAQAMPGMFLVKSVFRVSSLIFFGLGVVTFCWTSLSVWSLVSVPDGFRRRARAGCVCP